MQSHMLLAHVAAIDAASSSRAGAGVYHAGQLVQQQQQQVRADEKGERDRQVLEARLNAKREELKVRVFTMRER